MIFFVFSVHKSLKDCKNVNFSKFLCDLIMTKHFSSRCNTNEICSFSGPYYSVMFPDIRYVRARFLSPSGYLHIEKTTFQISM